MPQTSIRELVESWRPRYLKASCKEKSRILDEFVALTGYHRKSAIRLLRHGYRPKHLDRRRRPRVYTPDVKAALLQVWEACGCICSKCLAPFLPEIVAVLKRAKEELERMAAEEAAEKGVSHFMSRTQLRCNGPTVYVNMHSSPGPPRSSACRSFCKASGRGR